VAGLTEAKQKYLKGFKQRWSEVNFTLLLADPFRRAFFAAEHAFILGGANKEITVHNGGNADTPLTIQLLPAAAMPDVQIEHLETGRACRIRDSLLTSPASLIADTGAGTVRRGAFNAINTFSGQFLYALPGLNTCRVTSAAGQIVISFTERWLI
jgi:hypothetical protein